MSGHTQEPWSVGEVKNDDRYRPMNFTCPVHVGEGARRGNCIAIVYLGGDGGIICTRDSVEANARRIVACVNACRHLTTEQLESVGLDYAGCSTLADIRAALGVGEKPMLSELAGVVRTRMGVIKILEREAKENAAEVERLTAERDAAIKRCDALSQDLKLTEEELDDVQGKLDEAEEFSSASLTLILRHVGEPEIEEDDFVSITDLEQSIMRHNAVSDAAVRDRDAAVEALKKWQELFLNSDMRPEDECHECYDFADAVLTKIEGGRNA